MQHHRRQHNKLTLLILIGSLLLCSAASASDDPAPWSSPFAPNTDATLAAISKLSPPPLSATEEPADIDILLYENDVEIDSEGRRQRVMRLVYKILTQRGVEGWGQITADWARWIENRPVLEGRVISRDGAIFKLDQKSIVEETPPSADQDILSDDKRLRAPLPAISIGAVVETRSTVVEHTAFFKGSTFGSMWFSLSQPIRHAQLTVRMPKDIQLTYQIEGPAAARKNLAPTIHIDAAQRMYRFEVFDVAVDRPSEPYVGSTLVQWPKISYSTGTPWKTLAGNYAALVENTLAPANLGEALDLVKKVDTHKATPEQVLAQLVHLLHEHVRYTGLELGETAIIPKTPAQTFQHRFGDCKDKATALVAMARQLGIEGYVALLYADNGRDIITDVPAMQQFNHAIAYFPKLQLWVDATAEMLPIGELPHAAQGRYALVCSDKSPGLIQTPSLSAERNSQTETRDIAMPSFGKAAMQWTVQSSGAIASSWRHFMNARDAKKQREWAEEALHPFGDLNFDSVSHSDVRQVAKPFNVILKAHNVQRGQTWWNDAEVYAQATGLFDYLPDLLLTKPEEKAKQTSVTLPRLYDFVIPEAFSYTIHYVVHPPTGFVARQLPNDLNEQVGPISIKRSAQSDKDGVVHLTFSLTAKAESIPAAQLDHTRTELVRINETLNTSLLFDDSAALMAESGDVVQALQQYRRRLQDAPNDAITHARYAGALNDAGFVAAARQEAKKAVALDGSIAPTHLMLGFVLKNDELGQGIGPTSDIAGAIKEYEQALALDPTQEKQQAQLAHLYEYNTAGEYFGLGAPLDKALAQWDSLAKEHDDNTDYVSAALTVLLQQNKLADLLERAQKIATPDNDVIALEIVSQAFTSDVPTALRSLSSKGISTSRRAAILQAAAQTAINLRRYEIASKLTLAYAEIGDNPVAARQRGALQSKFKQANDLLYAEGDARRVIQEFFVAAFQMPAERQRKSLQELIAPSLRSKEKTPNDDELESYYNIGAETRSNGLSDQVTTDLMLGMADLTVITSYQDIAVVRMRFAGTGEAHDAMTLAVREHGKYYLVSLRKQGELAWLAAKLQDALANAAKSDNDEPVRNWLEVIYALLHNGSTNARFPSVLNQEQGFIGPLLHAAHTDHRIEDARLLAVILRMISVERADETDIDFIEQQAAQETRLPVRAALDLCRMAALSQAKQYARAAKIPVEMQSYFPDQRDLALQQLILLRLARDYDTAEKLVLAAQQKWPEDDDLADMEASIYAHRFDYAGAVQRLQRWMDAHPAHTTSGLYNNRAWFGLFAQPLSASYLEDAQKSAELSNYKEAGVLHTLASALAEAGRTKEALEITQLSLKLTHSNKLSAPFYYVLGRIAEHYELPDVALSLYQRVSADKSEIAGDTHELAARRILGLNKIVLH